MLSKFPDLRQIVERVLVLYRVDRHFSGNHQNDEDEAKESYL